MAYRIKCAFFFHDTDYYSGGSRSLLDLIDTYIEKDIMDVVAVFPASKGSAIDYLKKRNVSVVCSHYYQIRYDLTESKFEFSNNFPERMLRMIFSRLYIRFDTVPQLRKRKVNVVYSNTSFILSGYWAAKILKVPVIAHFREFGEEDHHIGVWFGRNLFYRYTNQFDKIVCISQALKKKYEEKIDRGRICVIYDDVSRNYINWNEKMLHTDQINILLAGNLTSGKGQLTVVKKLSALLKRKNNIDIFIAGNPSSQDYVEQIKKCINENGLTERVHFLGLVKDMNELRKKMHIGIVLSEMEAFGRVTIEGMLSGMIMITSNTAASAELIQDYKTGFLIPSDGTGLDCLVEKIAGSYDDFMTIRKQGFQFALSFTEGHCAEEIARIFKEIIVK